MNRNKKGQVSIEVVIIIIFLIIFITVFNDLSNNTVETIELYKIKEQQSQISDSLYSFLKSQEIFVTDVVDNNFNVSFENTFKIPNITIPSKNVECKFIINPGFLNMIVEYDDSVIYYDQNMSLNNTKFSFSDFEKYCGEIVTCYNVAGEIACDWLWLKIEKDKLWF